MINLEDVHYCTFLTDAYGADSGLAKIGQPLWFEAAQDKLNLSGGKRLYYCARVLWCPLLPSRRAVSIRRGSDIYFKAPEDHEKWPAEVWAAIAREQLTGQLLP